VLTFQKTKFSDNLNFKLCEFVIRFNCITSILFDLALGLEHKIGNFEVGKEFDALCVQPNLARSKFVVVDKLDSMEVCQFMFIRLQSGVNIVIRM